MSKCLIYKSYLNWYFQASFCCNKLSLGRREWRNFAEQPVDSRWLAGGLGQCGGKLQETWWSPNVATILSENPVWHHQQKWDWHHYQGELHNNLVFWIIYTRENFNGTIKLLYRHHLTAEFYFRMNWNCSTQLSLTLGN